MLCDLLFKSVIYNYFEEFGCCYTSESTILYNNILSCSFKFSTMKYHAMSFFFIFTVNLFAFNHLVTFSSSLFNVLINFEYSVPSRKTLESSAKSIENNIVDKREKSFMNNMKANDPV